MRFADPDGLGLVVNSKFDRLGHALADYDDGIVQRLLDRMDEVRDVVARAWTDAARAEAVEREIDRLVAAVDVVRIGDSE